MAINGLLGESIPPWLENWLLAGDGQYNSSPVESHVPLWLQNWQSQYANPSTAPYTEVSQSPSRAQYLMAGAKGLFDNFAPQDSTHDINSGPTPSIGETKASNIGFGSMVGTLGLGFTESGIPSPQGAFDPVATLSRAYSGTPLGVNPLDDVLSFASKGFGLFGLNPLDTITDFARTAINLANPEFHSFVTQNDIINSLIDLQIKREKQVPLSEFGGLGNIGVGDFGDFGDPADVGGTGDIGTGGSVSDSAGGGNDPDADGDSGDAASNGNDDDPSGGEGFGGGLD